MISELLPTGTVTFLFTDIEGSTRLWEAHGEDMRPYLAAHDALLRAAVSDNHGHTVKTTGDGLHAVFASAADALRAALQAQRALQAEGWPAIAPDRIRVRMGLHTGEAELRDGDYYGSEVNRAARLMSIGHGDQLLISATTAALMSSLPDGVTLRSLGDHSLRGLARPERVYQVETADLPQDFPPLRSLTVFVGNLPTRVTSFIGRARELAQVREALRHTRLLTLTGPGGTGKTTLSLQVAADVQPDFEHGTWWVELAPVTDPDLVPVTVLSAMGLAVTAGADVELMLLDYLREKQALLVLDNCEHLIGPVATLAAELLETCPRVTILASSREGLGVYGETTIHLPTLTLPTKRANTAELARTSEAVQLFVERAAAVRPGFALTDENAAAVGQVVRRLDGIPLAIELAAARVNVFSIEQIAARLDDRFRLLTGGSRTALPRQQTLRALVDWSYDLLDEDERALFRHLSVFQGGWTFDAAEFMAGSLDVYTILPQLINKSLVVTADAPVDVWGEADTTAELRYTYLETIRQYARDRLLESGESTAVRDRHFDYFAELAAAMQFGAGAGAELLTSGRLLQERDNLEAAVEWGLDNYPLRVIDLCWDLAIFLSDQNPGGDGDRWVEAALARLDNMIPATTTEAQAIHLSQLKGAATSSLLHLFLGELFEAFRIAQSVVEPLRAGQGEPMWLVCVLFVLAQAGYFLQVPEAEAYVNEALDVIRRLPDQPTKYSMQALALLAAAQIQAAKGNAIAQSLLDEAATMMSKSGDYYMPWTEYVAVNLLQAVYNDPEITGARLEQSLAKLRKSRSYRVMTMLESDYSHQLRAAGRLEEAAAIYRRTIVQWRELGHRAAVANQLECLAFIYRAQEQPQRAAQLLGAAEHMREVSGQAMLGDERVRYDAELTLLAEALPPDALAQSWAEGRTLSTDAAIRLAIAHDEAATAG